MIGQTKLINKLNNFTISSLPHSLLLIGERGSEQKEICDYIAEKFNLVEFNITDTITDEFLTEIKSTTNLTLFIINTNDIGEREQNILLKFYEEPSEYNYIVLLAESESSILDTIKTRSYELMLDTYSKDCLRNLIDSKDEKEIDLILNICNTPGQIDIANHTNIIKLYDLCDTIMTSMNSANFSNAVSISDKINFTDEYNKFDLYLFTKMFKYVIFKYIQLDKNDVYLRYYNIVSEFNKFVWFMSSKLEGKKRYFENFIINLWSTSRNIIVNSEGISWE